MNTMTGRVFGVLFAGVCISAFLSLAISALGRNVEFRRATNAHLVDIVANFVSAYDGAPVGARQMLLAAGVSEFRPLQHPAKIRRRARVLERLLRARLPSNIASIYETDLDVCYFTAPRRDIAPPANCWEVTLKLKDGTVARLALSMRSDRISPFDFVSVYYVAALLAASGVLALIVARMVTSPLAQLSTAALAIGNDMDDATLPTAGPVEVRNAVHAFEFMRNRLRKTLHDRTQVLASIAHDLQTPLTRMRLRVGAMSSTELRDKLLSDLTVMQALVRDGLELAQSAETSEPVCALDIDSMLQSLAQDATDAGQEVRFIEGCGLRVWVRPMSLQRSLTNLIDNAVKFGGQAEISSHHHDKGVVVTIRDFGPGIPESSIAAVMEPYVRLEESRSRKTGGVGLGLTIAQVLASKNNAAVSLSNHPSGGLVATIGHLRIANKLAR